MQTLKLKNGTEVRVIRESDFVVVVEAKEASYFDENGLPVKETFCLSKRSHKGYLLLDGVPVI